MNISERFISPNPALISSDSRKEFAENIQHVPVLPWCFTAVAGSCFSILNLYAGFSFFFDSAIETVKEKIRIKIMILIRIEFFKLPPLNLILKHL